MSEVYDYWEKPKKKKYKGRKKDYRRKYKHLSKDIKIV